MLIASDSSETCRRPITMETINTIKVMFVIVGYVSRWVRQYMTIAKYSVRVVRLWEFTFLNMSELSICMWRQKLVILWYLTLSDFSTKDSAKRKHRVKMILEQDTAQNSQVLFSSGFKRCPVNSEESRTYTKEPSLVSLACSDKDHYNDYNTSKEVLFSLFCSPTISHSFNLQTTSWPQWLCSALTHTFTSTLVTLRNTCFA